MTQPKKPVTEDQVARREVAAVTAAHLLAATEQFIISAIERRARRSIS